MKVWGTPYKPLEREEFVKRVNEFNPDIEVLGDYTMLREKILVKDKYGLLNVQAQSLYKSKPTIECAIDKTAYWINKAVEKHGDKYDYSNTVYVGGHKRLTITCRKCGDFEQKASDHLQGRGCAKCSAVGCTAKSFESFVEKSIERNGDIYEFEVMEFPFRRLGKLGVLCKECGNKFETQAYRIINKQGCPSCCKDSKHPETESFIYQLVYDNEPIPYVGLTTTTLSTRLRRHKECAFYKSNTSPIVKYLEDKNLDLLTIKELDCCRAHELADREDYWITTLDTKFPKGLNKNKGGTGLKLKYIPTPLEEPQPISIPL